MKMRITYCAITLLSLISESTAAEIAVAVASNSPATSMTANQVADIFLGRSLRLVGGAEAVPLDLPELSPIRKEFYEKVTGKTPSQVQAHWLKLLFAGKGEPPVQMTDIDAMIRALSTNPYAIGYLPVSKMNGSLKTLLIIR